MYNLAALSQIVKSSAEKNDFTFSFNIDFLKVKFLFYFCSSLNLEKKLLTTLLLIQTLKYDLTYNFL